MGKSANPILVLYENTVDLDCLVGGIELVAEIEPNNIDITTPPIPLTVTSTGISTQYGMPVLQYYDPSGTFEAQMTLSSVSPDGTQATGTTPDLSGLPAGTYTVVLSNAGPNGTYTVIGAADVTLYAPTPSGYHGSITLSNGATLNYYYTYSTGTCGYQGDQNYEMWSFSEVNYVDSTGTYPLAAGGAYINSPGGEYCPPSGTQPSGGVTAGPTGPANNIMVTFYAGEGSASATITQQ